MKHLGVFFCFLFFYTIAFAQDKAVDSFEQLDRVFQVSGKMQEGGVYKFSWSRSDLQVKVNDVRIEAGLALGSWAAFPPFSVHNDVAFHRIQALFPELLS